MTDDLKPCPTCASEDIYVHPRPTAAATIRYEAGCRHCGLTARGLGGGHDSKEQAIVDWNRRTEGPKPPDGLVGELRAHVRYTYMPTRARKKMERAADRIEELEREAARMRPVYLKALAEEGEAEALSAPQGGEGGDEAWPEAPKAGPALKAFVAEGRRLLAQPQPEVRERVAAFLKDRDEAFGVADADDAERRLSTTIILSMVMGVGSLRPDGLRPCGANSEVGDSAAVSDPCPRCGSTLHGVL